MTDDRLTAVDRAKAEALEQSNNMYNGLMQDNQALYDQQMNYANQYNQTQNDILDKQLNFQKEQIQKQKDEAQKNFKTESLKAKNDYTAFTNPYGYQAEAMASRGLNNSGVSETAKLGGFNTYQNRLASANKAMQDAFTQYDTDWNKAVLENDVSKAQNALQTLQMQLDFAKGFYDTKSQLSQNQLSNNQTLDQNFYGRYQDVINQINYEKQQEEARRQWEAQMAYQRERDAVADAQWQKQYNLSLASKSGSGKSSGSSSKKSTTNGAIELTDNAKTSNYDDILENAKRLQSNSPVGANFAEGYLSNQVANGNISEDELKKITKALKMK